jgi:hypothetical protein
MGERGLVENGVYYSILVRSIGNGWAWGMVAMAVF